MSGLQLAISFVMSFFMPGYGQQYQARFDDSRKSFADTMAIWFAICAVLCAIGVGFIALFILWFVSIVDCTIYVLGRAVAPATSAKTVVAFVVAALCFAGMAQAQDGLQFWEFDMKANEFYPVAMANIQSFDSIGDEPCCNCTKENPCNMKDCKHGIRCKCCKKEAIEPCASKSSACGSGGTCTVRRCTAERTLCGRRFLSRRGGCCRSCR